MLVIAVAAIVGHVCTPGVPHAHAAIPQDDHHHHDGRPGHDGSHGADALHAASCEALRPAAVAAPAVAQHAVGLPAAVGVPSRHANLPGQHVLGRRAPPIYLLHAALLI